MITSPFNAHTDATEVVQGRDLSGKTILITGAASGIGVETARALLGAGATVVLAVRDTTKGQTVAQELGDSTGHRAVSVLGLDLSSLDSVRRAADEFLQKWSSLDVLINNAGVMATPPETTADGFEMQFGTNHLGHFLLANLLLPALLKAAPARVVALSSSGHRRSDIHWDDLMYHTRPYDKWEAYGQSKTANALFAVGLTQKYAEQGLTANALNPGGIRTGLQKHIPEDEWRRLGWVDAEGNLNPLFKTVEQGASTSVWAAIGPELDGVGGLFLEDCQEASVWSPDHPMTGYKPYACNPESAARLWDVSQKLVGLT